MKDKIIKYTQYIFYFPLAILIFLFIRLISKFFLVRFNFLPTARIGHMAIETELYLSEKKSKYFDIFASHKIIANKYLLKLIKKKLNLIPSKLMFFLVLLNNKFGNKKHLINLTPRSTSGDRDINNILDKTHANLKFSKDDLIKGENFLKKYSIRKYNFVCLHIRDEQYLSKTFPEDKNLNRHSHRNCTSRNYIKAVQYLIDNNITVIKMGQKNSQQLNIKNPRYIDYANSSNVSPFLDIFLPAHCKFFLSSCSGLDFVAKIFRRPILFTNQIPIGSSVLSSSKDMVIMKKYFSLDENKYLNINEIFSRNLELIKNGNEYKKLGVDIIENNSIEILNSTKDMIKFLDDKLTEDPLEIKFKEILKKNFKTKNLYNLWHNELRSRISPSYLNLNNKIYF